MHQSTLSIAEAGNRLNTVGRSLRGRRFWRLVARLAGCLILLFAGAEISGQVVSRETDVQAVILFNLAHFLAWPARPLADPNDRFVIGILGRDPFGTVIDEVLDGEQVESRAMIVERFRDIASARDCEILFIAESEKGSVREILSELEALPVLTVSTLSGFAEQGGDIEFVRERGRVRFRINLRKVRDDGIDVSASLLSSGIAIVVDETEGSER